jgi:pilus assembly protein CpaF
MASVPPIKQELPPARPLRRPAPPEHQELKFTLHRKLLDRINLEVLSTLPTERARAEIRAAVARLVEEERTPLSLVDKDRIIEEVLNEVFGLGPLEPLLQDPTLSDILVTTPRMVYVERDGKLFRSPVQFKDDAHLLRIIEKVVSRVGRRIDESSPMVDARLPDGSRVNAVIPPVAIDGPLLSIRRFGRDPLTAQDLLRMMTMPEGILMFLEACVKSRLNIIVSGGTGAGKTTLLNVLSAFIPEDERIVTIEDAAELQLRQTHVARMEARPPNIEGKGAIKIRAVRHQRAAYAAGPDHRGRGARRRGPGHAPGDEHRPRRLAHHLHCQLAAGRHQRLEVMVGMANANMGVRAIRQQVASAVDLFVHLQRLGDGTRKLTHVTEVVGMEGEQVTTQDIFVFEKHRHRPERQDPRAVPPHGHPAQVLRAAGGLRDPASGQHLPDHRRDSLGEARCPTCWSSSSW